MVPGAATGGLCAQVPTEFDVPRVFDLDSYSKENLLQPEAEHDRSEEHTSELQSP